MENTTAWLIVGFTDGEYKGVVRWHCWTHLGVPGVGDELPEGEENIKPADKAVVRKVYEDPEQIKFIDMMHRLDEPNGADFFADGALNLAFPTD